MPPEIRREVDADVERLAFVVRGALLRSLVSLHGVSAVPPAEIDAVEGPAGDVARAVAAREILPGLPGPRLRRRARAPGHVRRGFPERPRQGTRRRHPDPSVLRSNKRYVVPESGSRRVAIRCTHLIEDGYDIRTAQKLLGHKDIKTTEI